MEQPLIRRNHYVPVWYQRRFLAKAETKLFFRDLKPESQRLADGQLVVRRAVSKLAPKSCFWKFDLYTTQFGATLNDEIERHLFGKIDDEGAISVRAFAGTDHSAIHKSFVPFFEYLDAQKLRTPKGLDWIKSRYPGLTQPELMLEMQGLRQMHCTMWSEGVREIVSAENSDVKFIVTDHPVTTYNAEYLPDSDTCCYPSDPLIDRIGTQTVFALDANHCIILTNLEYAKRPDTADLTAQRTNARYRGQSLVRTDAFIRSRKLSSDEVVGINFLLMRRARKYIAAGDKDSVYPERQWTQCWRAIGNILLPRHELWQFGGEIYVGYADGSTQYQDEFGRTSGAHQYLKKKQQATRVRPNDSCGCGSGRKFKRCCEGVPDRDRPSWVVFSIRERNLMLCRAVVDILGLNDGKTWRNVQRELSDEQVKRIHETFGSLWPNDTDLSALLPRPDPETFRAVFLGITDPRTVSANVLGWLAYFDEVIVAHPFVNPGGMKPEYSPAESPAQYKEETLKNALLLLALEPYIDAGLIHLIPAPTDFNSDFRRTVWDMAQVRTKDWKHDKKDSWLLRKLADDDFERSIKRLPLESLKRYVNKQLPSLTQEQIVLVVARMKEELESDPYALLQPVSAGKVGAQLRTVKGFNLEVAMFLAGLTRSIIYTDLQSHWQHLHEHTRAALTTRPDAVWRTTIDTANSLIFPIELDVGVTFQARAAGKFGRMRKVLNRIANSIRNNDGHALAAHAVTELRQAAEWIRNEWIKSASETRSEARLEVSIPTGGFEINTVRRLFLTFGGSRSVYPVPMALLIKFDQKLDESE